MKITKEENEFILKAIRYYWMVWNDYHHENEVDARTSEKLVEKLNLHFVTNRTFRCDRCNTTYKLIKGDVVGCCVSPARHRTSGICGGQLIEVID